MQTKELQQILLSISNVLQSIKFRAPRGTLRDLAKAWGVSQKNLNDFMNYRNNMEVSFRVTMGVLRGIAAMSDEQRRIWLGVGES
jgi:hypothetical protein